MDKPQRVVSQASSSTMRTPSAMETNSQMPNDLEIRFFLRQLNQETIKNLWKIFRQGSNSSNGRIQRETFIRILTEHFDLASTSIAHALYRSKDYIGFGVRLYTDNGQEERYSGEIELHDIILALTIVSNMSEETKLSMVFDLTDVDEDGCLSPEEIAKMIETIERIFAKENINIQIKSRVILEQLSKDKAKRRYKWTMKSVGNLEEKCLKEEGLVTFVEFAETLDKMPNLKRQFLPKYIHLDKVLQDVINEPEFTISDINRDDFLMFRYELQALFSRGVKYYNKAAPRQSGQPERSPTFTHAGQSITAPARNRPDVRYVEKECIGLVKVVNYSKTPLDSQLPQDVWEFNSNKKQIFVRKDQEPLRSNQINVEHVDKSKMMERIVFKRPAQIAEMELEAEFQKPQYKHGDDEEHKTNGHSKQRVEDIQKKVRDLKPEQQLDFKYPVNYYLMNQGDRSNKIKQSGKFTNGQQRDTSS